MNVVRSLPEPDGRVVAVPVVRPEASRKVVRSDVPVVWVVADPVLRPWPSVKVVRSLPGPVGRVVAVPTVRPEASRIVVRSVVPVVCVVAEPALRPFPSVRVVRSVLDCAIAVVAKIRHATRRIAGMASSYANTGSTQFETGRWQWHRRRVVPANRSAGGRHPVLRLAHRTLVITKMVKRLSMNRVAVLGWCCDTIGNLWNHHSVKAGGSLFLNAFTPIPRGPWG